MTVPEEDKFRIESIRCPTMNSDEVNIVEIVRNFSSHFDSSNNMKRH